MPKRNKTYVYTKTYPQISIATLFIRAESRNNPNVHTLMRRLIKYGTYKQWIITE